MYNVKLKYQSKFVNVWYNRYQPKKRERERKKATILMIIVSFYAQKCKKHAFISNSKLKIFVFGQLVGNK